MRYAVIGFAGLGIAAAVPFLLQTWNNARTTPASATLITAALADASTRKQSAFVQWGAYAGDTPSDSTNFEAAVGKKMDLVAVFMADSDPFPSQFGPTVRDEGKTLIVFWEPTGKSLDDINAKKSDADLRKFATAAKSYGGPVIFAPFHEMNGNWSSWGGTVGKNTPRKFITAWRHVHAFVDKVPNVRVGWVVNNRSIPLRRGNSIELYYPGDAYVDYVGVDGFNEGSTWETFDQTFSAALTAIRVYHKPVYIFSMASAEGPQKAAWITDALAVQIPSHPEIVGWVWFNQDKEKDWRVWSEKASLRAFQKAIQ